MSKTTKKNFRFSDETCRILTTAAANNNTNESRIAEIAIAAWAMETGECHSLAKQFLYDTIVQRVAAHQLHRIGQKNPKTTAKAIAKG